MMNGCLGNSKRNYNSIDLAKFICAIMVVSIHVAPFGKAESESILSLLNYFFQQYISRLAVPFFFVCSGFFLFKKTSWECYSLEPAKKYVKRIFRLYILWTIIYAPLRIGSILKDPKGIVYASIVCCRDIIFTGSYSHLWYFPALIFAVLLISFLTYKKIKPHIICIMGGAFML